MWLLHNLAEAYGRRPSEMLGVDDEWAAYQLDVAVLVLGRYVESQVTPKRDAGTVLRRLRAMVEAPTPGPSPVRTQGRGASDKRAYRALGYPGMPKMRVPENGIW